MRVKHHGEPRAPAVGGVMQNIVTISLRSCCLCLALLSLGTPAMAQDADDPDAPAPTAINRYIIDTGPLRIRDQFLLGMGFLGFDPVSADVLSPGEWQVDLIETATNTFAHSEAVEDALEARTERAPVTLAQLQAITSDNPGGGVFLVDGELYRTAIAVRRGVGKGVQLELVVPLHNFQGGMVDSVVEDFHKAFGFDQVGRKGLTKDSFHVYVRSQEGEFFVDDDPDFGLEDIVLGAKFRLLGLTDSRRFLLALETLVKIPTGGDEPLGTSDNLDLGAQLLTTRYFSKACLHASIGVLRLGELEPLGLSSQVVTSGMVAYERSLGAKTSGLVQLTLSESPFRDLDLDELARASSQVTFGFKRVVWKTRVLFVGLTENVASFNSTADIGIHLGLTQIFD